MNDDDSSPAPDLHWGFLLGWPPESALRPTASPTSGNTNTPNAQSIYYVSPQNAVKDMAFYIHL